MELVSFHDIRLLGIPIVFFVTYLLGYFLFPSQLLSLAVASVTSGLLVVDCLFLHPPREK